MGGIFPKFFPEIFCEYVTEGIDPPFDLTKRHKWGGYGGGEGGAPRIWDPNPPCHSG